MCSDRVAGCACTCVEGVRARVLVNLATVSAVFTGAFTKQLPISLGEVMEGASGDPPGASFCPSGPVAPPGHGSVALWTALLGMPVPAQPSSASCPENKSPCQDEGRETGGCCWGQTQWEPRPLGGEEGQRHPYLGGQDPPSLTLVSQGGTWFEAHACLSVQSLWLRTYHHWISSE